MRKYNAEEREAAKKFLNETEMRLNTAQDAHWRNMSFVSSSAQQDAQAAEGKHLSEQWKMLHDMRKQFGV